MKAKCKAGHECEDRTRVAQIMEMAIQLPCLTCSAPALEPCRDRRGVIAKLCDERKCDALTVLVNQEEGVPW